MVVVCLWVGGPGRYGAFRHAIFSPKFLLLAIDSSENMLSVLSLPAAVNFAMARITVAGVSVPVAMWSPETVKLDGRWQATLAVVRHCSRYSEIAVSPQW